MGVKESRHIAGLKDISTPSGTGEAMLGTEERFCIVSLYEFGVKEVHEVITTVSIRNAWVSRCMALC